MRNVRFALLAVLLISIGACSNDSTRPVPTDSSGTVQGQINDSDFEIEIDGGTPDNPFSGPFTLLGRNLHYDDDGNLAVDLYLRNSGGYRHQEPISLTFLRLNPPDVRLLNSDNHIDDDGAAIIFHFADDDGVWTPGEVSLARMVLFSVSRGVSIAFTARVDIGGSHRGGTIAGRVWNDYNENGVIDEGEPGIFGADVMVSKFALGDVTNGPLEYGSTRTDRGGYFAFYDLSAGGYEVATATPPLQYRPTTPSSIRVFLVETEGGGVSSYRDAGFGMRPQLPLRRGDYLRLSGHFGTRTGEFSYRYIDRVLCDDENAPPSICSNPPTGRLRGAVTEIAPDRTAFRLMATWVLVGTPPLPGEAQVGTRLDVHVHPGPDPSSWVADEIAPWDQTPDEIHGHVESIDPGVGIRVLGTLIVPYSTSDPGAMQGTSTSQRP